MAGADTLSAYTVDRYAYLSQVVQKLSENEHKGLIVLDGDKVCGTFTRADMVRCSHCMGMQDVTVEEFFNRSFTAAHTPEEAESMKHSIIPVVDEKGKLTDICFPIFRHSSSHLFPVVVMAGGKGTRLYPYTRILPKPLVPLVGEQPMVETIMDRFHSYGPDQFFMIVNYKKEMIKDYFKDVELDYSVSFRDETTALGTGGGLYLVRDDIDETFCLTNCDIILRENLDEIYEFHKESGNLITMITALMPVSVPYGVIKVDERQKIREMVEKPTYMMLVNIGIYFVEPEVFHYLSDKEKVDFPTLIGRVKEDGKAVGVYPITNDSWLDMGQVNSYEHAREVLRMKLGR